MARGRSKGTVVNNQLQYTLANGVQYIDIFRDLSALNRKLIRQGRVAYLTDISYTIITGTAGNGGFMAMAALPNDWVTNNAWKKAQSTWRQNNKKVRAMIGESAKPTWEDFKVFYDAGHRAGTTLAVPGLSYGEWMYSQFVWEADDNSIDEVYLHMHGNDVSTTDAGLVLAYQESRATVNAEDPDLPADYSHGNIYAYMATDDNAVADEVAQNMEDQNDAPPYDHDDYPGNDSNLATGHAVNLVASGATAATVHWPAVVCAPLGLIKINHQGVSANDGSSVTAPTGYLNFRIAYGNYKGLAAPSMGQ